MEIFIFLRLYILSCQQNQIQNVNKFLMIQLMKDGFMSDE